MSETYKKIGDDNLAVTTTVDEQTLLDELTRQEKKRDRIQEKVDILKDKLAVING